MKGTWSFVCIVSCIKAAIRFTLWFSIKEYLWKYKPVDWFYKLFSGQFKFVGLVPIDDSSVFFDILPEILTMLFGALIKYRVAVIIFSKRNS
jgi:hypothetical protein